MNRLMEQPLSVGRLDRVSIDVTACYAHVLQEVQASN